MGRDQLIERACELLRNHSNVAISAGPGLGKTYVSEKIREEFARPALDDGRAQPVFIPLDLSTLVSGAEALGEATDAVRSSKGLRTVPQVLDMRSAVRRLEEELQDRSAVLGLDEFDAVRDYPDASEFLRNLRQMISQGGDSCLTALLLSRRPIRVIEEQIRGISTLSGVCFPLHVTALSEEEISKGWIIDRQAASENAVWSGGLPRLVDFHAKYVSAGAQEDAAALDHIRLEAFNAQIRYLDEAHLLDALTQHALGPVIDDLPRERAWLAALGLIPVDADSVGSHSLCRSDLFMEALEARSHEGDAWGRFGAAEKALRGFVDATLTDAVGVDWPEQLSGSSRAVARVHQAASATRERDRQRYGGQVSWLSYTYPAELWLIIADQWPRFQGAFAFGDKQYWKERIEGLATLRAPLAHNRGELLSGAQRLKVMGWADDLLRGLSASIL